MFLSHAKGISYASCIAVQGLYRTYKRQSRYMHKRVVKVNYALCAAEEEVIPHVHTSERKIRYIEGAGGG